MDERIAKWQKVGFTNLISKKELTEIYDPQILLEERLDDLMLTLKGFVLTAATGEPEVVTKTTTILIKVPATWWQHLKLTQVCKWWWPFKGRIRFKSIEKQVTLSVTVEPRAMFPNAKVPFPQNFDKPVIYYYQRADWSW